MKTLTERINVQFGEVENAHVMQRVHMGFAAYDTLCLICAELDVDLTNISDSDFNSTSIVLENFISGANEGTGYTVSAWFDEEEH